MPPDDNGSLGGINLPPDGSQNAGASSTTDNSSASAQVIRQRKERSDKGQSRKGGGKESAPSVPALSPGAFAKLYDPEIWGRALAAPADTMAAITGKKHWEISDKEREHLGASGAIAAQCYAVTDPRALAACLCLITLLDVYGVRFAKDWSDSRKEKAEAERKKKEGLHTPST